MSCFWDRSRRKYACKVEVKNPAPVQPEEDANSSGNLTLTVDGTKLDVAWEDNASVEALKALAPLTINMNEYGGFEQTGKIGSTIVSNDVEITTQPGDIVLYNGNQVCLYYDENTWSFTRLGRVQGLTDLELKTLLDRDSVTAVISVEKKAGTAGQDFPAVRRCTWVILSGGDRPRGLWILS